MIVDNAGDVGESVEKALASKDLVVERIAGRDHIDTSIELMKKVRASGSNSDAVVIAASANYADALSISPWAYASASPIVYAQEDGNLGDSVALAIKADPAIRRVIIVGGQNAVTDSVIMKLGDKYEYTRLAGNDRYETSAGIARWVTTQGLTWSKVAIATGNNFADALPGGAAMGSKRNPLMLVHGTNDPTVGLIREKNAEIDTCYILGGISAVPDALADPKLYSGPAPVAPAPVPAPNPDTAASTSTGSNATATNPQKTEYPASVIYDNGTYLGIDGHLRTDSPDVVMDYCYSKSEISEVFHYPWCDWVGEIMPWNRTDVHTSARDLSRKIGRRPCKECKPPKAE